MVETAAGLASVLAVPSIASSAKTIIHPTIFVLLEKY
jgi:hypothetical protein